MQLDLLEWINSQPASSSRLYALGSLTGNRPGTTPRVHARFDQERAICGARPASMASRWVPSTGQVTCPKCVSLLRWNEEGAKRFAEHHPGLAGV